MIVEFINSLQTKTQLNLNSEMPKKTYYHEPKIHLQSRKFVFLIIFMMLLPIRLGIMYYRWKKLRSLKSKNDIEANNLINDEKTSNSMHTTKENMTQ